MKKNDDFCTNPADPAGSSLVTSPALDAPTCAVCFYFGHCQNLNHHDIKLDAPCPGFSLALPSYSVGWPHV